VTKTLWAALLLTASCAAALGAQEHPLAADHPGAWAAPDVRGGNLPPATRTAALAVAKQIEDILRKMPVMAPAAGFEVVPHTVLSLQNADRSGNTRLPQLAVIELTANIAPYERTSRGVEANERDTAASVTVAVNDFSYTGTTPMGDAWSDDQGAFIESPEDPVDTRHGFPVFQEGNGDRWLLMRRRDVPVVSPVSRERYLLCVTKQAEDALSKAQARRAKVPAGVPAEIVATIDEAIAHGKTRVANLQKQYQGMTAADRRLPAVVGSSEGDAAVNFVDSGDGTAYVSFNPALIDSSLPPAAPQVMSIRLLSNDALFPGLGEKLDQQLDWAALAKLLR
jgi:hypothetical protein